MRKTKAERLEAKKARKQKNHLAIESAKKDCAKFVGVPYDKYSSLELVLLVAAKLEVPAKGDIHPNQQIKHYARLVRDRSPSVCVNSTRKDFYDSRAWKILRYQAFEKYGNRCQCCGATVEDGVSLHADHIKPKSTNPELALDINNIQILCLDCNVGKINQWDTDWRP